MRVPGEERGPMAGLFNETLALTTPRLFGLKGPGSGRVFSLDWLN